MTMNSDDKLFDLFDSDSNESNVKKTESTDDVIPEDVEDLLEESVEKSPKKKTTSSFDDLFDDNPSSEKPKKKDNFENDVPEVVAVDKKVMTVKKEEEHYIEDEVDNLLNEKGFELVEADEEEKAVLMFYGRKGEGKTYQAFKLPGNIVCLSFDGKSVKIKNIFKEDGERIKVYDAMKYYKAYPGKEQLRTGKKTFLYVEYILDELAKQENKPDWIIIDGLERLHRVSEMVMRYDNDIMPYDGFANLNLWKIRRDCLAKVHAQSIRIAKKGVGYTTYLKKERVADEVQDSEIADDVPKWIGVIMEHTDVVFKCYKKWLSQQLIFRVTIESSKDEKFPTGRILNVTDSGVFEQLGIDEK